MMNEETKNAESESRPAGPQAQTEDANAEAPLAGAALAELKSKAAKADHYEDAWIRMAADFENYKKRAARERQEASKYASETVLKSLIPVLDNFDMALGAAANPKTTSVDSLQSGIQMIYQRLKAVTSDAGLQEIEAAHQKFDPAFHEAVADKETTEFAEGTVVQQLRKGYRLRERLLRPATVIVAKKPSPGAAS